MSDRHYTVADGPWAVTFRSPLSGSPRRVVTPYVIVRDGQVTTGPLGAYGCEHFPEFYLDEVIALDPRAEVERFTRGQHVVVHKYGGHYHGVVTELHRTRVSVRFVLASGAIRHLTAPAAEVRPGLT